MSSVVVVDVVVVDVVVVDLVDFVLVGRPTLTLVSSVVVSGTEVSFRVMVEFCAISLVCSNVIIAVEVVVVVVLVDVGFGLIEPVTNVTPKVSR